MSTFEIVRGVEGDCLVLNDTRICGPKPWGGGRIIKTFRTDGVYEVIDKDEYRKLMAENAKLRELATEIYPCAKAYLQEWRMIGGIDSKSYDWYLRLRELGVEVEG